MLEYEAQCGSFYVESQNIMGSRHPWHPFLKEGPVESVKMIWTSFSSKWILIFMMIMLSSVMLIMSLRVWWKVKCLERKWALSDSDLRGCVNFFLKISQLSSAGSLNLWSWNDIFSNDLSDYLEPTSFLNTLIFTKFHQDRTKNVEFLVMANFWACLIFFYQDFTCSSKYVHT